MNRRTFIAQAGAALTGAALACVPRPSAGAPQTAPDVKLEIAPLALEIAPGKVVHTVAYNGRVPGPLIRWPEGKPIAIDVLNRTTIPDIVHWHGLMIPSDVDGSMEEGSPMIAPGDPIALSIHAAAGGIPLVSHAQFCRARPETRHLYGAVRLLLYRAQRTIPAPTIRRSFSRCTIGMRIWDASGDSSMEAAYDYATIDGRMLGFADPLKVTRGATSAVASSECERQHGSLAGTLRARNDRGRHGRQSGARGGPDARDPLGARRAHRCRRHDESAGRVDSRGDARPITQDGHGNRR